MWVCLALNAVKGCQQTHPSLWPQCKCRQSRLMFSPYSNDIEGGSVHTIEPFNLNKWLCNKSSVLQSIGWLRRCLFVWHSRKLSTSSATHECMRERQQHPCPAHGRQGVKWRACWKNRMRQARYMTGLIFEVLDKCTQVKENNHGLNSHSQEL